MIHSLKLVGVLALVAAMAFGLGWRDSDTLTPIARAADDEGSEASEPSEDEGSESGSKEAEEDEDETEAVTRTYTVIEKVSQVVMVTPEEYLSDRDGDLLVDALDPNPDVHQREYFTDDDGDSVANAYDSFPGSDDLVMLGSETDDNQNGIVDRYES